MKKLIIVALCLSTPTLAGTMYKCKGENSIVTYQKRPCTGGAELKVIEQKQPKPEEVGSGGSLEDGILIGDFELKDDGINSVNDHWFSYKVKVWNRTEKEKKLYITFNAIDSDGFKIDSVSLSGTILPNSYEELSDRHYMKPEEFKRVTKWVLNK